MKTELSCLIMREKKSNSLPSRQNYRVPQKPAKNIKEEFIPLVTISDDEEYVEYPHEDDDEAIISDMSEIGMEDAEEAANHQVTAVKRGPISKVIDFGFYLRRSHAGQWMVNVSSFEF